MRYIRLAASGLMLASLLVLSSNARASPAEPLPPFGVWQRAALAPDDWGPDIDLLFDRPDAARSYGRIMQRRGRDPIETVSVFLWDGSVVSPSQAVAFYGIGPRLGLMQTDLPPEELPSSLGPDVVTDAHTLHVLGVASTTVRIAWRHGGWTVVLSVASTDTPAVAAALALRLAERQQAKLFATFSLPVPQAT